MKTPTTWVTNTNANDNRYTFDSSTIKYDSSATTYDGITVGESQITTADPVTWSDV